MTLEEVGSIGELLAAFATLGSRFGSAQLLTPMSVWVSKAGSSPKPSIQGRLSQGRLVNQSG